MAWSDKYIGIPFKVGGRGFDGCDCAGLVLLILREEKGIVAKDTGEAYTKKEMFTREGHEALEKLICACLAEWRELGPHESPCEFDLAIFEMMDGSKSHCGCFVDRNSFIHADNNTRMDFSRISRLSHLPGYTLSKVYRHEKLQG